jgi:hypothetical protein
VGRGKRKSQLGRSKQPLKRGPFTTDDIKRALTADHWSARPGGGHQTVWEHPTKPGKVPISEGWSALEAWCPILNGLVRTTGLSKSQLLRLLNGRDADDAAPPSN